MHKIYLVFLLLLVSGAMSALFAQQVSGALHTNDKNSIAATVVKMFDGLRAGDSAMVRSVMMPGARLVSVGTGQDGKAKINETSLLQFLTAIGKPHTEV